ncbi:MAG: hypothetical protein ACKOQ6_12515 [Bacteroidota bacterium]
MSNTKAPAGNGETDGVGHLLDEIERRIKEINELCRTLELEVAYINSEIKKEKNQPTN